MSSSPQYIARVFVVSFHVMAKKYQWSITQSFLVPVRVVSLLQSNTSLLADHLVSKSASCPQNLPCGVYDSETEPAALANEVMKILQGKKVYEKIVIGVDPGEVFGLAVIADGKVNETGNCFSTQEALAKISSVIKNVDLSSTTVSIKIGSGVPAYKELLETLNAALPPEVVLEVVSETGTNRVLNENKHRRGLRDIASAIRIAGRAGHIYPRRRTNETNV